MRTVTFALICFFVSSIAAAQAPRINVGPFAGMNITTSDPAVGWNAGMMGLLNFQKNWEIQAQIGALNEQNFQETSIFDGAASATTTHSNRLRRLYIEGSSLLDYNPHLGHNSQGVIGVGFGARLLLASSGDTQLTGGNGAGTHSSTYDLMSLSYRWNYHLPLQVGMNFKHQIHSWSWRLEYSIPLRDLYDFPPPDASFDYAYESNNVRYETLSLKLIYMFPVGNRQ